MQSLDSQGGLQDGTVGAQDAGSYATTHSMPSMVPCSKQAASSKLTS